MTNVIKVDFITRHTLDSKEMLTEIAKDNPKNTFVICWPESGELPTYHCNTGDMPVVLLRLQQFIHKYYNGDFE